MADTKISGLADGGALAAGDEFVIARSGDNKRIAKSSVLPTPYENLLLFGDGSDGDVTINGAVTLTRDMYYHDLTLAAGAALNPAGYHIHVSGTLDISAAPAGAISAAGFDANAPTGANEATAGTTNGANDAATYWLPANARSAATSGVNGTTAAGGTGQGPNALTSQTIGGGGGYGGGGGTTAGGTLADGSRPAGVVQAIRFIRWAFKAFPFSAAGTFNIPQRGGNGVGDGVNKGGAAGSKGGAAGVIWIAANIIARGTNVTAGIFTVNGGKGGRGGVPTVGNCGGGGGGGGGPGGYAQVIYGSLTGSTITNAITAIGGDGGAGGAGVGTAGPGDGAQAGDGGVILIATPDSTTVSLTLGTTGGSPAGTVGGTGGTCSADL